ncbi:MAG: PIG-L family deacetylase [Chloroflexi bacterium]|nr:PIG-L family deacetylase [Chloroflexota bacterium]
MKQERSLLYVGAHPDDETFGVGGTLALYSARGAKTYYACATRGEAGTVSPEHLEGFADVSHLRWHELECAAKILGLAGLTYLGYRDSGMPGSEDNKHPDSLFSAPAEQVVARIVKVIRELKPQVVVTYDAIGGYGHPDHVKLHDCTTKAFAAAPDPHLFPEAGGPFQPQKLYYSVFSRRMLRLSVRLMSLLGKDPHHFGVNRDIDLASLAKVVFPVHAVVRLDRMATATKRRAFACHASQLGGGPSGIFRLVGRILPQQETFMRAFPPAAGNLKETDLFQGVAEATIET